MAFNGLIPFLIAMMLITGVCNTLLTKYQDNQCVVNCEDPDPEKRQHFNSPFYQTLQMFVGEAGCWLVVGAYSIYRRVRKRTAGGYQSLRTMDIDDGAAETMDADIIDSSGSPGPAVKVLTKNNEGRLPLKGFQLWLLALPTACDVCGTTLMNIGLLLLVASIYQMTRGALVLFVGLFSVLFLKRRLVMYQWFALVMVVLGVGIVGLAGALYAEPTPRPESTILMAREAIARTVAAASTPEALRTILGILLVGGAQVFTATQFVLEEFILEKYALEPIKVVGWEGLFGFLFTAVGMAVLHLTIGRTEAGRNGNFDAIEGWRQITTNTAVGVSSLLIMISIGGFNFFGLSVTRTVSATSRSTIDTCRTLFIWIVSIGLGWETFKSLQVVGFAMLVYGTFLFNGLVGPPLKSWATSRPEELLPEEPIEHL